MICRVCPKCGGEWLSADTNSWPCAYCGAQLDSRHDGYLPIGEKKTEITEGMESNVGGKLHRQ